MNACVSVVIPCYNYGHFLSEAIESCLRQTLSPTEVVVVDDGSLDDTGAVVSNYSQVRYVWQSNKGLAAARNRGLAEAQGDFLVFLDADDMLSPAFLQRGLAVLEASPLDVAYVYTPVQYFGRMSGVKATSPFSARTLRYGNYINASALFRRSAFDVVKYDESLPALEDFDLYLSLVEHGFRGRRLNEPLVHYRKHSSMTDQMQGRWKEVQASIFARHPALYPRHVRALLATFGAIEMVPLAARATWRARVSYREVVARVGWRSEDGP